MERKKLHKLEALRGFAALYVLFHHASQHTSFLSGPVMSKIFYFGQEVVMLFFILSGFVIQYSFTTSNDKSFRSFFIKRFNRIYIPLIIVMILNIFIFYCYNNNFVIDFQNLAGNLLMLQDYNRVPRIICEPFLNNFPLWSLSYEWWFYMAFFLIFSFTYKKAIKTIYIVGIIATVTYLIYPFWGNRLLMYLMLWNIGASFANCYIEKKDINFKTMLWPLLYILIAAGILALNFIINKDKVHSLIGFKGQFGIGVSPFLEFRHFLTALTVSVVGIIWRKLRWRGFKYTIGVFEWIAPVSYCLYISHFFMITKASYLSFIGNEIIEQTLYFVICLIFSYVVERIIYPKLNKFIVSRVIKKKPLVA